MFDTLQLVVELPNTQAGTALVAGVTQRQGKAIGHQKDRLKGSDIKNDKLK